MKHDDEGNQNNDEGVEDDEEDWSDIIESSNCNGDALNGHGFARHDTVDEFPLVVVRRDRKHEESTTTTTVVMLKIASVASLSPIDMINLSWGSHDATGHRIWLGARLLLHAVSSQALLQYLEGKRILELGAGTGMAGIAIVKAVRVRQMTLTDASPSAMGLCEKNCKMNDVKENVEIQKLSWGDTLPSSSSGDKGAGILFDTVVAADVLYDLNMWKPILQTASRSLSKQQQQHGTLILSHVPRAAIPEEERGRSIEDIVLEQAKFFGFELVSIISPKDLSSMTEEEQQDVEDTGAAIFVWRTTNG